MWEGFAHWKYTSLPGQLEIRLEACGNWSPSSCSDIAPAGKTSSRGAHHAPGIWIRQKWVEYISRVGVVRFTALVSLHTRRIERGGDPW